jgi:hypothetical protein
MTTASSITTSQSNSDSLSSDDSNAIGLGKFIGLPDLDAGANLDSRANIAVGRLVLGVELGVLQPVGPDGQSTLTRSLAVEVMAGVLHHEAEVEVPRKVNSELDLGNIRGIDHVGGIAAIAAGAGVVEARRHAAAALVERAHDGCWVILTVVSR